MNKTIILIAAAALFTSAQAGTIFSAENNAGGRINLTDERSSQCEQGLLAYATTSENLTRFGCWTHSAEDFRTFIRWLDTRSVTSYPTGSWMSTPYLDRLERTNAASKGDGL